MVENNKRSQNSSIPILLEFHITRAARDKYQFDQRLFSTNGNVIFADFRAVRQFTQRINERRNAKTYPDRAVRAGEINAMGLIDEILHLVIEDYRRTQNPRLFKQGLVWLDQQIGRKAVDEALLEFCAQFPPKGVHLGIISERSYFEGDSVRQDGSSVSNRELLLEEMLMLWIANQNPAQKKFNELFQDAELKEKSYYREIFKQLHEFFATQPTFGPEKQNLIDLLLTPAREHPNSLAEQLLFILSRWKGWLSIDLLRLLSSLDIIREEQKPIFGLGGEPQSQVYTYAGEDYSVEQERFSRDQFWMPNLVLLAKNTYVWLDQLARKYQRQIEHLDQVPEEELALLASWGFTGLWLIGLWERSQASRKIKQLRGNNEAVASAYSLRSYDIAADLGGEQAYQVLREKAWRCGIRLASDMVPNHMGIDSNWVVENPDWFIQLPYSPFPAYSFNGQDLSSDESVAIFIEDHYFDNSDAAVVFKRVDRRNGQERYIYHGNDGTSMPWNDTAQLNYLLPEVREAVIQTILHVARKFPIIRFDAAMTLAKRHYQRLWFPDPGSGGDIPSRSEQGMSKATFNQLFPEEFWRMVVDRVAAEAPDTLLLAEAFWLMEGYFVRTLGMHRVYNSAFMNMLRDEKNQEYRLVIKNTLEFDPQILKRYVNFMSNPDERTAVDQFGKSDKYFGICTMMVAMPGLPMFGHGQIEGYTEKYGMEFRYPKWHELPDEALVERHQRQIFDLIRRRHLFADVVNFRLYDFFTPQGGVNEDVFAFSNQDAEQRVLVVYHNHYGETNGWIRMSAAFPVFDNSASGKVLTQTSLAEALDLHDKPNMFIILRDFISGMEYIRPNRELFERGLFLDLNAYRCHVFMQIEQLEDDEDQSLRRLYDRLRGVGVHNVSDARQELIFEKIIAAYEELVNPGMLEWLFKNRQGSGNFNETNSKKAFEEANKKILTLLETARETACGDADLPVLQDEFQHNITSLLTVLETRKALPADISSSAMLSLGFLQQGSGKVDLLAGDAVIWGIFISGLITAHLGKVAGEAEYKIRSRSWLDEWMLSTRIKAALVGLGLADSESPRIIWLLSVLISAHGWYEPEKTPQEMAAGLIDRWLLDPAAREFLQVHAFEGVLWFNKESYEELVWWVFTFEIILLKAKQETNKAEFEKTIQRCYLVAQYLDSVKIKSGYQLDRLLQMREVEEKPSPD